MPKHIEMFGVQRCTKQGISIQPKICTGIHDWYTDWYKLVNLRIQGVKHTLNLFQTLHHNKDKHEAAAQDLRLPHTFITHLIDKQLSVMCV